jgi:hypothetical protein
MTISSGRQRSGDLRESQGGTLIGVLDSPSIENLQRQIAAIDAGLKRLAKALSE